MTKYCVMRECENILRRYLYDGDLVFVILKEISIFKFIKRFLEVSSRDLTSSFISSANLKTWLPTQPLESMPFPFEFAWLNAFQAVTHSDTCNEDLGCSEVGTRLRLVVMQNVSDAGEDPGLPSDFKTLFNLIDSGKFLLCQQNYLRNTYAEQCP